MPVKEKAMKEQQQGSGSAENTGRSREEQVNRSSEQSKQDVARDANLDQRDISSIDELGQRSGRDDWSGGSGDQMSGQSSGEATDR
ncbi:MAG: hypothetical protein EOP50_05495 [Sphingobacteriales bacterium]|nr:MAG: hypothetical protein EOP50_05495 [Sphingobacteriales bacterium]